jgi:hypothetical protein
LIGRGLFLPFFSTKQPRRHDNFGRVVSWPTQGLGRISFIVLVCWMMNGTGNSRQNLEPFRGEGLRRLFFFVPGSSKPEYLA